MRISIYDNLTAQEGFSAIIYHWNKQVLVEKAGSLCLLVFLRTENNYNLSKK